MTTIALEEHTLPKDIAKRAGIEVASLARNADALDDLGDERLKVMDAAGIDVQVLGPIGHEIQELEPAESTGHLSRAQRPGRRRRSCTSEPLPRLRHLADVRSAGGAG